MIYEKRVYTCAPGQLPKLLKRFEESTLGIWKRLGIRSAGFLTPVIAENNNELTYFLIWDTMAEREEKWGQFQTDPEWIRVRTRNIEANGEIVTNMASCFMQPVAFADKLPGS